MMEQSELTEFMKITQILSGFIKKNKIGAQDHGKQFTALLKRLMKIHSMKGMKDLLSFSHYLNRHEENSMKLQCQSIHCIQCYRQIIDEDFYDAGKTQCTCLQIITPIYKKKIIDNFNRIEALRTLCIFCQERKDNMNFVLKSIHPCEICTKCLTERYTYGSKENSCGNCNQIFNEDCDTLIRDVIETSMDPGDVRKHYLGKCLKCRKEQDTREFNQICAVNKCKVCKQCVESIGKEKIEACDCGDRISILR